MDDFNSIKYGLENKSKYVYNQNVSYIRKTIMISIALYTLFSFVDLVLYPELLGAFLTIRLAIVLPILLVVFFLSYTRIFEKYNQHLIMLIYYVAGAGIIAMIFHIKGENFYTNGLFLVFAIGFHLIRLKWLNSMIAFLSVLITFILVGELSGILTSTQLYANAFFYLAFSVIGVFGSFFNDRYLKSQFDYEAETVEKNRKLQDKINYQLSQINKQLEEINISHRDTIIAIAKLAESRDTHTGDHLIRVGMLSKMFAEAIPYKVYQRNSTVQKTLVDSIELTSILHDIGKIAVSDQILNKPGKLTEEEFETMKTHTTIGAATLMEMEEVSTNNSFVTQGIEIAKYHHERWDGSGYPSGLIGEGIPLSARIVAIIDVYDALVSNRPYKGRFSKDKSLSIIKEGKGSHFDPELVDVFVKLAENSSDVSLFWK